MSTPCPVSGPDGARARFDAVYSEHAEVLARVARRLCGDSDLAQDLTQETWLRAWRSLDGVRSPGAVRGWLIRILRREHARRFEKKIDAVTHTDQDLLDGWKGQDGVEEAVLVIQVLRALGDCRHPLILELLVGLSTAAVALRLGISENAVRIRICRERQRLRRLVG